MRRTLSALYMAMGLSLLPKDVVVKPSLALWHHQPAYAEPPGRELDGGEKALSHTLSAPGSWPWGSSLLPGRSSQSSSSMVL